MNFAFNTPQATVQEAAASKRGGGTDGYAFVLSAEAQALAGFDIETIRSRADFDALETEWNILFEHAARPDQFFQNFNWLWHWANHFLDEAGSLRIITGRYNERLVMVWPLVETKTFGLRKLVWMGEPVSQYGDALVEPATFAQAMLSAGWREAGKLGADIAFLRKTRAASSAGPVIAAGALPLVTAAAPVLDFGNATTFDHILSRLSAKARSSRRRLGRRLQEQGNIRFSERLRGEEPEPLIRAAFEFKRQWLTCRGLYSPAIEDDRMLSFFISAALSQDHAVAMPIDAIYKDAQPIGIGISLECKGEALGHIMAYDICFEKQGAGVILTEHILKSSFERGCARFDMLAPQDAYKMEWTDQAPLVHDWLKTFSLKGFLYAKLYSSGLHSALMRWLKNLPRPAGQIVWPMIRYCKKALAVRL